MTKEKGVMKIEILYVSNIYKTIPSTIIAAGMAMSHGEMGRPVFKS
jgi:hypothetical protein